MPSQAPTFLSTLENAELRIQPTSVRGSMVREVVLNQHVWLNYPDPNLPSPGLTVLK